MKRRHFILGYVDDGEIAFYRTTSLKRLNTKQDELKEKKRAYNTLVAEGHFITFK